jgi:DNA topoisomerase-1
MPATATPTRTKGASAARATPAKPRTPRLRRSDPAVPGIRRMRQGRGFRYIDEDGRPVTDEAVLQRIAELVIPPAWKDVWICPYPGGHIQATGIDEKGRKQYLYHPRWRARRDQEKFDDMVRFAEALPALREVVDRDIARADLSREQVLACATRLLERGFFRIGSEDYAVTNDSYGLATMRKEHVNVDGETIEFDYPAKSGKRRVHAVVDADVAAIVAKLKARRTGGDELLAYKQDGSWRDVKSSDINEYLKQASGLDISAKDFRTWGATVLAAVALAVIDPGVSSKTARKRAIMRAVREVAHYLGNTPAVARASYIDPRVFDRYRDGETIRAALGEIAADDDVTAIQGPAECAVLDLLA